MSHAPAVAVVFAGGVGSRMLGAAQPKQFLPVEGKPLLVHTLERFQEHPEISAVYLSCLPDYVEAAWELVRAHGIDKVVGVVPGGASAQESIYLGLQAARADGVPDDAVVLVHDGVRPLINARLVSDNISTARAKGNAITAIPCFETIARSVDGAETIESVTRREQMYILQAPQTFVLGPVLAMNERSVADGLLGSFVDQAQLARHYGQQLHMVEGFRGNVKVTTDLDLLQLRLLAETGHLADVVGDQR